MNGEHAVVDTRLDLARPADHPRSANRTLVAVTQLASGGSVTTTADLSRHGTCYGGTVVRDPDHNGVVSNARLVDSCQHFAGTGIQLDNAVPVSKPNSASSPIAGSDSRVALVEHPLMLTPVNILFPLYLADKLSCRCRSQKCER